VTLAFPPNSENVTISYLLYVGEFTGSQQSITLHANPGFIPSVTTRTSVSSKATDLTSKTTYHFTILVENDHSVYGEKSFITL
jgi:hypothetical protein